MQSSTKGRNFVPGFGTHETKSSTEGKEGGYCGFHQAPTSVGSGETRHGLPARGTSPSVEEGIELYLPQLRRRALQLTKNRALADDLLQDSVERALRFRTTFQAGGHLRAWLLRIMKNLFVSQQRRRTTERRILEKAGYDPNGWAVPSPIEQSRALFPPVERALKELPERLRAVVSLVDLNEGSYRDAAEREQVPLGTIMSRLHRGRTRLKNALRAPLAA